MEFPAGIDDGPPDEGPPAVGFFLLSVYLDVESTLQRLAGLGLGGEASRITLAQGSRWRWSTIRTVSGWN